MGQKDKTNKVTAPALSQGILAGDAESPGEVLLTSEIDLGKLTIPMTCLLATERRRAQS